MPLLRDRWPSFWSGHPPAEAFLEHEGTLRAAVTTLAHDHVRAALEGIERYCRAPEAALANFGPVLWREGTTRVLGDADVFEGSGVLVVPSLVNRAEILQVMPEQGFVEALRGQGHRVAVVDWGEPGAEESAFDCDDYVRRLVRILKDSGDSTAVVGYCMGGTLALAAAALARQQGTSVDKLVLLAAPWNFHAPALEPARKTLAYVDALLATLPAEMPMPALWLHMCFYAADPFLVLNKFRHFRQNHGQSALKDRLFVAVEQWLNNGVPLARGVAHQCFQRWYGTNDPFRGLWRIDGTTCHMHTPDTSMLVVVASRDTLVPPACAWPYEQESLSPSSPLPRHEVLPVATGHIGLMASRRAPEVWSRVSAFLHET